MIKVIVAIPKRPDISDEKFHAHWREPHGRLALRIKPIRRYVQAHRIPYPGLGYAAGPYEGYAEVWFDTLQIALGLGQDPDYQRDLVPDEPKFIDVPGLRFLMTEEDVALAGPPIGKDDRYFKILQLVRRARESSPQTFRQEWAADGTDDAPARAVGAVRHVRCRVAPGTEPESGTGFDAVRELWWPSAAEFEAGRARAPQAWKRLIEARGVDPAATLVVPVDEYRVLWPG
jgi:hypothetical protein